MLIYLSSSRGLLHAGEAVVWPLLLATLSATILWANTANPHLTVLVVSLTAGLALVKSEGVLYAGFLVAPWVCVFGLSNRRISFRRECLTIVGAGMVAAIPLVLTAWHQHRLGIGSNVYQPFSLLELFDRADEYRSYLWRSMQILVGLGEGPQFVPYAYFPLTLMMLAVCFRLRRGPWFQALAVPAGVLGFLLLVPSIYVFANRPVYWPLELLEVSWNRLLVAPVIVAVAYTVETMAHFGFGTRSERHGRARDRLCG